MNLCAGNYAGTETHNYTHMSVILTNTVAVQEHAVQRFHPAAAACWVTIPVIEGSLCSLRSHTDWSLNPPSPRFSCALDARWWGPLLLLFVQLWMELKQTAKLDSCRKKKKYDFIAPDKKKKKKVIIPLFRWFVFLVDNLMWMNPKFTATTFEVVKARKNLSFWTQQH